MAFNTYIFILLFLPLTVLIYFLIGRSGNKTLSKSFLAAASAFFIGYADSYSLLFLLISILVTYLLSRLSLKGGRAGRFFLVLGVVLNILSLGVVKYSAFVTNNLNRHLGLNITTLKILVPIGISFVCFQQIMFLVDSYKGEIKNESPLDYLLYILFFPKLVQGPITDYNMILGAFDREDYGRPNSAHIAEGLWLFSTGLAKKVLLADVLSGAVSYGWDHFESASWLELLLSTICFTMQIYFDFSGYSSMAIGIAEILNIPLKDNFRAPYRSLSIDEFWKSWHISLTDFLRKYIYFPLGGSRKGRVRTYLNILIVFLISGLWHGADWTFLLWGLIHGVVQCLYRLIHSKWDRLNTVFRWCINMLIINTAWIFFRSESISQGFTILKRSLQFGRPELSGAFLACFDISELSLLTARSARLAALTGQFRAYGLIFYGIVSLLVIFLEKKRGDFKPTLVKAVFSALLIFFSVISLSTVVEFIYGGF